MRYTGVSYKRLHDLLNGDKITKIIPLCSNIPVYPGIEYLKTSYVSGVFINENPFPIAYIGNEYNIRDAEFKGTRTIILREDDLSWLNDSPDEILLTCKLTNITGVIPENSSINIKLIENDFHTYWCMLYECVQDYIELQYRQTVSDEDHLIFGKEILNESLDKYIMNTISRYFKPTLPILQIVDNLEYNYIPVQYQAVYSLAYWINKILFPIYQLIDELFNLSLINIPLWDINYDKTFGQIYLTKYNMDSRVFCSIKNRMETYDTLC